ITRFKGEGVGGGLVKRVLEEARTLDLRYVFACTVDERAEGFFARQGFVPASADDVPAVKWVGYEPPRRAPLKGMRCAVARGAARPQGGGAMHRGARLIGTIVAAVGVAALVSLGYYVFATLGDFHKAQMLHERNPGNAMYDLQYFVAATGLGFTIGGAVCGA